MSESQTERIKRLGNRDNIWYGQSGFRTIRFFPCDEFVVVPAGYARAHICEACGEYLKAGEVIGTMDGAVQIVVEHLTTNTYAVYHPECAQQDVNYAHEEPDRESISAQQSSLRDFWTKDWEGPNAR